MLSHGNSEVLIFKKIFCTRSRTEQRCLVLGARAATLSCKCLTEHHSLLCWLKKEMMSRWRAKPNPCCLLYNNYSPSNANPNNIKIHLESNETQKDQEVKGEMSTVRLPYMPEDKSEKKNNSSRPHLPSVQAVY